MAFEITVVFFIAAVLGSSKSATGCFESIVSFGDSLADTGNYPLLCPANTPPHSARPPYGRTFFHHPTGRCSDGRLVIDFIARHLGLPLVKPYIAGERGSGGCRSFSKGVNFAVVGSTALDYEYYEKMGIHNQDTNVSLGIQLNWFKQFLAKIPEFKETSSATDYNPETGCLNWLNKLAFHHKELLLKELNHLQELYPNVTIIYADYYNVVLRFYRSPNNFGFKEGILSACCGSGGPYNFNITTLCGIPPATSCDDPSSFVSWDGIHLTEAANRLIAQGLFEGPYTYPQIKTVCPLIPMLPQVMSIDSK